MTQQTTYRPDVTVEETDIVSRPRLNLDRSRISWGAVIAGVVLALIIQITMNLLGMAIGAATLSPEDPVNPVGPTFTTGAVIWIAATSLLSTFAGGYVAAHLSGIPDETDSVLHGLLTWAVATFIVFFMLTSGLNTVVTGISNLVTEGISLVGAGVADVAPNVANAIDLQDSLQESIREEAGSLPADTEGLNNNTTLILQLGNLAQAEADSPEAQEAQQALVNLLNDQTNLTEEEAQQTVQRWVDQIQQAAQNARELAEQAASDLADALASTGGILFLILVVGAFAGGSGGYAGRPDPVVETAV